MKKHLFAIAALLMSIMAAQAQSTIFHNPDNKAYFGIRLGAEVTCPGAFSANNASVSPYKNGGGVELGGIYHVPLIANFYLEPGLKLYYNEYSLKGDFELDLDYFSITSATNKKFGMRIPVMAGYHFDFTTDTKVSVFTGPELEIGFVGKEYFKGRGISGHGDLYGPGGSLNRVNLLWGFGAGITYQQFYFGVSGGIGMLNMLQDSDVKFRESRVTFSLGYNF